MEDSESVDESSDYGGENPIREIIRDNDVASIDILNAT